MRKRNAFFVAVLAIISLVTLTVVSTAQAATTAIVTPSTNPFVASAGAGGLPQSFTIVANGFTPNDNVFVEQCDGVPATDANWSPGRDCDFGSAPPAAIVDGTGTATFDAASDLALTPFRGISPEHKFNCLAPGQADPDNSRASFDNCQVRVSTNNDAATSDQVFLGIVLPKPANKGQLIGSFGCQAQGNLAVNPALTSQPSTRVVKAKGAIQALNPPHNIVCDNGGVGGGHLPLAGGQISITLHVAKRWSCAEGAPLPTVLSGEIHATWLGISPKSGHATSVGRSNAPIVGFDFLTPSWHVLGSVVSGPITSGAFRGETIRVGIDGVKCEDIVAGAGTVGNLVLRGFEVG